MEHGNLKELRAIDLDSSDNLSEEMLQKFITVYGPQLHGLYQDDICPMGPSMKDERNIFWGGFGPPSPRWTDQ